MTCRNIVTVSAAMILITGCAFGGKSEQAAPVEQPLTSAPSSSLVVPPSSNPNAVVNSNVTGTINATGNGLSISDQPVTNSYPYGTAAQTQEPAIIQGTDGNLYSGNGYKTNVDYQSDVASCHYYAQGLVSHDARVESDRGGSFGDSLGGGTSSIFNLRRDINTRDTKKRQAIHFNRCMNTKGYYQR